MGHNNPAWIKPKAWLLREIKSENIKAIKVGGWRIRRTDLEQL